MTFRLCMTALLSTVYLHAAALADEGVRAGGTAQYAVATASSEATDAGMRVLATGGSAADAAVAIQMVLGVVEPQSSGLGGGAIALYQAAQERPIRAFDGLSKSPTSYDPGSSRSAGFAHSGSSVGVPGSLRMLEAMHRRYGKLPWSTLFQPAIRLADAGFAVSPYLARSLAAAIRAGMTVPGWLTDGSGNPAAPGTTVRNPQLADTLRAVSENGADALYVRLADQVVSATHQTAPTGRMTVEDMTGYKVLERDPLCMPLRHQVLCSDEGRPTLHRHDLDSVPHGWQRPGKLRYGPADLEFHDASSRRYGALAVDTCPSSSAIREAMPAKSSMTA